MQDEQPRPRQTGASGPIEASITDAATPDPNAPGRLWYANIAGKTSGPFSGDEIKRMAASGRMTALDFLCPEGGSAWIEAGNEPALVSLFRGQAPAAPRFIPPTVAPPRNDEAAFQSGVAPVNQARPQPATLTSKLFGRGSTAIFQRPDQDRIREDLRQYFGPRADKYLEVYEKMRASKAGYTTSRNWIVLLTGFPWYFYRKMYITGTLLIFLPALLNYLFGLTGNLGVATGLYLTANVQYVWSGIKRIEKADTLGLIGDERRDYLRRAGGVSVVAGTLSGLLCAAIVIAAFAGAYLTHRRAIH
jgi:hypothetical protein